jgi:WD40 repeat protein
MGVAWVDNETFVTGSADKRLKKWNLSLEKCGEI